MSSPLPCPFIFTTLREICVRCARLRRDRRERIVPFESRSNTANPVTRSLTFHAQEHLSLLLVFRQRQVIRNVRTRQLFDFVSCIFRQSRAADVLQPSV